MKYGGVGMRRSRLKRVATIATALLVAGLLPAWGADETENVVTAPSGQLALPELGSCDVGDGVVLEQTGLIIKPKPSDCLGSVVKTCDDVPIPAGGTCSCQSVLLEDKCVNCDTREKGLVLRTTCTVCPYCWSPPCDFMSCNDFISLTCTEI
jgi:hypothetical protein